RTGAARPIEQRGDIGGIARIGDDIGRIGVIAGEPLHIVEERFAVRVLGAIEFFVGADRGERGRRHNTRRFQCNSVERRRRARLEIRNAERLPRAIDRELLFRRRDDLALAAPAEIFETRLRHHVLASQSSSTRLNSSAPSYCTQWPTSRTTWNLASG